MTLGQTVGFICLTLALVALLFSSYAWFTRRSRAATHPADATHEPANWLPLIGAVALAAAALIAFLSTSRPTDADGAGGLARRVEPQADTAIGADDLTVADKIAAVDQHGGGSMEGAVKGLERRLAAKGGSDADWELLAKSYEFLGRGSDAEQARHQHLPAGAGTTDANIAAAVAGAASPVDQKVSVDGEVILSPALRDKVPAGLTLFIVAKSVNSPGPPVAILRTTTNAWPVRFRLDDTQAMMPQRKLSTAGPVTIEARTSKSGQAMPERGDFQGVTTRLDPSAGKPIQIVIERVIS